MGRWVFGLYPNVLDGEGRRFVSLWGTERLYKAANNDAAYPAAWTEYCALVGERVDGDGLAQPSGVYLMDQEEDRFIAYRSRGWDWWNEVSGGV